MENQVIRIGSVGVGGIWSGVHEPGIRKSPNLELVAICDIDREKLDAVGEKYGIPAERRFTDYHDLIRCPDVDAVDICTSNDAHFEIGSNRGRQAVRSGKADHYDGGAGEAACTGHARQGIAQHGLLFVPVQGGGSLCAGADRKRKNRTGVPR